MSSTGLESVQASGDFEAVAICQAADACVSLAGGRASAAHEHALAVLDQTDQLGPAHEAIRSAWPVAVEAALALERIEAAEALLEVMEHRPPGQVPPMLAAELLRNRGLLAAARDQHDTVEGDLTAAVKEYEGLGYPYLLARARADLGAWLVDRERRDEALGPLEWASAVFQRLGAGPALERVRELLDSDASGAAEARGRVQTASAGH